jgi:hypothetical protein
MAWVYVAEAANTVYWHDSERPGEAPGIRVRSAWKATTKNQSDGANWFTFFGRRVVYSAPSDPHIWVPKQSLVVGSSNFPMGYTLNMAHSSSQMIMAVGMALLPVLVVALRTRAIKPQWTALVRSQTINFRSVLQFDGENG